MLQRLPGSWRRLPALVVVIALFLTALGGGWSSSAADPGVHVVAAALAAHHGHDADATRTPPDPAASWSCADGACVLCAGLTAGLAPRPVHAALATWSACIPTAHAGRLIAPDTPPPIA